MKLDEFAFLNQQLAGMLRAGIPLEGSLRELSATMGRGRLRDEIKALEVELAAGAPFSDAIGRRGLPELYVRLAQTGASGGNLPGVLTLLADYYARLASLMARLKGLMVYPLIVLVASLGVSMLVAQIYHAVVIDVFSDIGMNMGPIAANLAGMWAPTFALFCLVVAWLLVMFTPRLRRWARWTLPGFRDASLSQVAGAAALLLRSGASLPSALGLLGRMEGGSAAGREMERWVELNRQGEAKWTSFTAESRVFPPLFRWLVAQGGEDPAAGFQRASEIYQARSAYKTEVLLYAALPLSILLLAGVIVGQLFPLFSALKNVMSQLGL